MASVSLSTLRTRARTAADMTGSTFVSDAELNAFINSAADELYDLLVSKHQDQYTTSSTFNTASGTEEYSLPADFYKLVGVDLQIDSDWRTLDPFNFRERNYERNRSSFTGVDSDLPRYWLRKDKLHLLPAPSSVLSAKLWYVPTRTQLTLDADTLDGVSGWEEYVVTDAAIRCLIKEESDPSALMARKAELVQRIERAAKSRDVSGVVTAVDIYADDGEWR